MVWVFADDDKGKPPYLGGASRTRVCSHGGSDTPLFAYMRYLQHLGHEVKYVWIFTDVDDKITSDGSSVGASSSVNDKSPLNEKSVVEDVSFANLDIKQTLNVLHEDSVSKKPENISHESQENKRYDICHMSISKAVKLKPPTAVINREKRNQLNCSNQGQNIIMLRSGMVLMKGYISFNDQVSIVKKCRELGLSDGGFYQPGYRDGTKLHLEIMCLGKNWDPESKLYSDKRLSDNA